VPHPWVIRSSEMNPSNRNKTILIMLNIKLHLFGMFVNFLNKVYLKVQLDDGFTNTWVRLVLKRSAQRGTVDTIAWIKAIRLACTRYLSGQPLKDSPGNGVQVNSDGLPKDVPVADLFVGMNPSKVRLALTLLGVSRLLPGWKSPDLSSITDPCSVTVDPNLGVELAGIVKKLGWKIELPQWEACHTTTKSGPNAQALIGSIEDASLLSDEQISDLFTIGGEGLVRLIGTIRLISPLAWLSSFKLMPKGRLARLTLVKDKEAKCRIVAILDYWTQTALKPLHDALMRLLKGLKGDCTFNQGSFRSSLPRRGPYYSMDLSSATDRMPVSLQVSVLEALVGNKEYVEAWRRLVIDRDYWACWLRPHVALRYAVGQPMGAYSSWTLFSVTHHAIVRLAATRAGLSPRWSNYALLGDDIVITNHDVAKEYRAILASIGVEVSEQKTHVSEDTYEFAKRWISRGTEVSAAPFGSLFEAITFVGRSSLPDPEKVLPSKAVKRVSYYLVATWFRELEGRWLPRSHTMVSRGLLASFFQLLGCAAYERLADKAWKFYLLPSREDSRHLRNVKSEILAKMILSGSLGCFSWRRATERIGVLLNECKARVLEEAIKRHMHVLTRFQLEGTKYLHLMPEGLDAQSVLLSLPPFAVLRRNIAELQLEFDKAHRVRDSDDISQWLHLDVRLFLDPFAALSTRKAKIQASSRATILNHLTAMCRGIETIRNLSVSDISLKALVELIMNHHVVPTPGNRSKKRKFVKFSLNTDHITDVNGLGKKS